MPQCTIKWGMFIVTKRMNWLLNFIMNSSPQKFKNILKKVCIFSSILIGWNVFLIVIFLTIIGISIILFALDIKVMFKSFLFYFEVIIAGVFSSLFGVFIGRLSFKWLDRKQPSIQIWCLLILILITLIFFPSTFSYVGDI